MKIGSKELFAVVRELVKEEIKKQAPGIIRECLTESYLKRLVQESFSNKKDRSLSERLEETEIEEPIFESKRFVPVPRQQTSNSLSKRENPLSFVYDGLKPIASDPSQDSVPSMPDVPIEKIGLDIVKMKSLMGIQENSSSPMQNSHEFRMREIEQRRKALDVPAIVAK